MDKVVAAIKVCTQFIIGTLLWLSFTRDMQKENALELIPFVIKAFFIAAAFEFAFYWHVMR